MNKEQVMQLQHLIDALAEDLYHPLGDIAFSGFRAEEPLSLAEAEKKPRTEWPEGTVWGGPRDYAWMFAKLTLPAEAAGERIVMDLNPGGESTLFLDGKAFGTRRADRLAHPHHFIVDQTVSRSGVPGETHLLALEAYGGTPLPAHAGRPILPERGISFENNGSAAVGHSTFGFWNEEAYQLWLDLTLLQDLYGFLDENDAMREQISVRIGRVLDTLDAEQPLPERRRAYIAARELLAPVMNAHNGTFAPSMGVIGNSHLDYAWLWPIGETRRKTARTFAAQLRLLKEYPEAVFLASQCAEYELCRQYYPELFGEVLQAIRDGRWIAEGGMWVEPDTNLTGGESLVRQFLYGKRYFSEVLGVDSQVAWLPDTFGYSAALPQIIRGFGMKGLTTQKIFWSYNDSERFPRHAFLWKGLDGTAVPSYLHMAYETRVDAKTLHTRWTARVEKDGSGDFYLPFGYGDGGGGPTRDDMEQIRRQKDLQGSPRLYWMGPAEYLEKRNTPDLPEYRGELYFPCHRGTYTSQAAVKKLNRRCETAMRAWELLAAYAAYTGKAAYPGERIEKSWKRLLINQFHDILPGSACADAYVQARRELKEIWAEAEAGAAEALTAMKTEDAPEGTVTLFNTASHGGTRMLRADASFAGGAADENGGLWPAMPAEDGALIAVGLPAMGSVTLRPAKAEAPERVLLTEEEDGYRLENGRVSAYISREGELLSMKLNGKERIASPSNRFRLYRDLPRMFDAWDIDSQTERREVFPERKCSSRVLIGGGLRAAVAIRTEFGSSVIEQTVSLDAGSDTVDFDTRVDWHETHRLLKVCFDTGIPAPEASHQIQFGYLDRPAHRSRQYDADRFEVCSHTWTALHDANRGAALLNDCKYGVGVKDGVIALSLLRAPTYPDAECDRGEHSFRYAFRAWDGPFGESGVYASAEALNLPVIRAEGVCPVPRILACGDPAIVTECVKLAEDGSGDLIARLYEGMGGTRTVTLTAGFPFASVRDCDLAERPGEELPAGPEGIALSFHPFEIKTLRFHK